MDSTFAEVLNKALEMGEAGVAKASEIIQGVAPELWEIMVRQVYADAIANSFMSLLGLAVFGVIFYRILKWKPEKNNSYKMTDEQVKQVIVGVISGLGTVTCTILSAVSLPLLIKALINPKFYALKNIADLF